MGSGLLKWWRAAVRCLACWGLVGDAARRYQKYRVHGLGNIAGILGEQQQRRWRLHQLVQQLAHFRLGALVQALKGIVQDQRLGFGQQRPGQQGLAAFAGGDKANALVENMADVQALAEPGEFTALGLALENGLAHGGAHIEGVVPGFAVVKTAVPFHHLPVQIKGNMCDIPRAEALAIDHLAVIGAQLVGDQPGQGGLAGAVAAQQGDMTGCGPLPVDVVENQLQLVGKTQVAKLGYGIGHTESGC